MDRYGHKILFQLYFALFINLNGMPRPSSALVQSVYAHFKDPCRCLNPGVLLLIYGIWSFHFLKYSVGNLNDLSTKLCQRAYVIAAFVVSSSPKVH